MTITMAVNWANFALGVVAGWASLLLLAVWLYRRRDRSE